MTNDQFDLLARLMRLRAGAAREVVRLVLVDGLTAAEAARRAGMPYRQACAAAQRAREWLESARRVVL